MLESETDSKGVKLSVRLYDALLRAYPTAFRADYAEPMTQLFRDRCRRAETQRGPEALLVLWAHTLLDLARTSLEERTDGGIHMNRSTFVNLSGWAMPIGAISLFSGFVAGSRPEYDPYNMLSSPVDRLANASEPFLTVLGFLLCAVGMAGLLVQYGLAAGHWARFGLGLGAASALIAAAGAIVGVVSPDGPVAWLMFLMGTTFMFVGLLVFGVACIQHRLLPRWNALPLLAAIWMPTFILGITIEAFNGRWEMPAAIGYLMFGVSCCGLALLGIVMLTDGQALEPGTA